MSTASPTRMNGRVRIAILMTLLIVLTWTVPSVFAGSPHFVAVNVSIEGNTLTVSGKEAGLGNETQVHIEVSADAQCVNPGGNKPQAGNKQSFSAEGDFPVQNGKANFSLTLTATFQPDCTPPMSVVWSNIVVSDTEHGVYWP